MTASIEIVGNHVREFELKSFLINCSIFAVAVKYVTVNHRKTNVLGLYTIGNRGFIVIYGNVVECAHIKHYKVRSAASLDLAAIVTSLGSRAVYGGNIDNISRIRSRRIPFVALVNKSGKLKLADHIKTVI